MKRRIIGGALAAVSLLSFTGCADSKLDQNYRRRVSAFAVAGNVYTGQWSAGWTYRNPGDGKAVVK